MDCATGRKAAESECTRSLPVFSSVPFQTLRFMYELEIASIHSHLPGVDLQFLPLSRFCAPVILFIVHPKRKGP